MKKDDLFCIAPVIDYSGPCFVRGDGCYVYDRMGGQYLDISCGQFSAILGHKNEYTEKAIKWASENIVHLSTGFISENFIQAAQRLSAVMPGMNGRIVLLSTGAEANEACLRYAKNMNNNKPGVISFKQGYHGLTHGTEGYSIARAWVKPGLEYSFSVDAPPVLDLNEEIDYAPYIEQFKGVVKENKDHIAAAMFEPVVSNGGMLYPGKAYWQEIRRICDENEIYLIFDECQTGFGRTGSWFYYTELGVVPDMLVCAKAMGLGFPVSMVVFNGNRFGDDKFKMHHFSSHQNEPFSAQLVLCAMDAIEKEGLLKNVVEMGEYLRQGLRSLQKKYSIVENPRGKGLMCGFDLNPYQLSKEEIIQREHLLVQSALENKLLLQIANYGKTVRIMPAYNIQREQIHEFLEKTERSIVSLKANHYEV